MTPLQFAKAQCCNYESDGTCTGVGIDGQGKPKRFSNGKTKCVLGTPGVRCLFFEECVAPMGFEDPRQREERNDAIRLYRLNSNAPKFEHQTGRVCPQCKKRELEPRKRFCYVCSRERKLRANRNRD